MEVSEVSYARFIYPFLFQPESFVERLRRADSAEVQVGQACGKKQKFPEDQLLSHVARYLNPPEDSVATGEVVGTRSRSDGIPDGLGARVNTEWHLLFGKEGDVDFAIDEVQLSMFRVGVGS